MRYHDRVGIGEFVWKAAFRSTPPWKWAEERDHNEAAASVAHASKILDGRLIRLGFDLSTEAFVEGDSRKARIARKLLARKKLEQGLALIDEAIQIGGSDWGGLNKAVRSRVKVLYALNRFDEALATATLFPRAIERSPRERALRVLALFRLRRFDEALGAATEEIDRGGPSPECHRVRSEIYEACGQREEAACEAANAGKKRAPDLESYAKGALIAAGMLFFFLFAALVRDWPTNLALFLGGVAFTLYCAARLGIQAIRARRLASRVARLMAGRSRRLLRSGPFGPPDAPR
jgi:tetratricopeptide (TPR) repeat protein